MPGTAFGSPTLICPSPPSSVEDVVGSIGVVERRKGGSGAGMAAVRRKGGGGTGVGMTRTKGGGATDVWCSKEKG